MISRIKLQAAVCPQLQLLSAIARDGRTVSDMAIYLEKTSCTGAVLSSDMTDMVLLQGLVPTFDI